MKGERGIGVGATFAEVFLASTSSQLDEKVADLSLQTRTRPAIEFVSGEEGPRPASSSISSSIRSLSTWT